MRPLTISCTTSVLGLQQEIQRSEESRYDHRLHGVLLVAQGMTCPEVARLLGDAPRSVENWVHRFDRRGLAGLTEEEQSGPPSTRHWTVRDWRDCLRLPEVWYATIVSKRDKEKTRSSNSSN